jgi:cation/acetate symporter
VANGQNVAFLVALAFAVAASANLPSILYSLYWRRFTTRGTVWSIVGGLVSSLVLIVFSPAVSGAETAMFPNADFDWFPLTNPALVSVPIGFVAGWLGSITSPPESATKQAEMEVRSMTGVGAEKAVSH